MSRLTLTTIKLTTVILFFIHTAVGQSAQMWGGNLILIGPDNVSSYHEKQSDYYINGYNEIIDALDKEVLEMKVSIDSLKKEKSIFKKKKNQNYIEEIEQTILEITFEQEAITRFMNYWKEFKINPSNATFFEEYDASNCYEITSSNYVYSPSEYQILKRENQHISWNEIISFESLSEEVREVVIPASTKWVKKKADNGCISTNPEDCMVWCLVETPAQYAEVIYESSQCPKSFEKTESGKYCSHAITTNIVSSNNSAFQIVKKKDGTAINIVGYREVNCSE